LYPGLIEYQPSRESVSVNVASSTLTLQFGTVRAGVLNIVPPQRAGKITQSAGLLTPDQKWYSVDFRSFESQHMPKWRPMP
jgi:sulfide dehydrogenase [flavocytochrome c] flavoprotein subunit